MKHRATLVFAAGLAGTCLAACGISLGAAADSTAGLRGTPWRVVASIATPGRQPILVSGDAPAPADAWALGFDVPRSNPDLNLAQPLLVHWAGRRWQQVPVPPRARRAFGMFEPFDITVRASSAGMVWLFGSTWLRLDRGRWQSGDFPSPGRGWTVSTNDAAVLGPGDVWIFGLAIRSSPMRGSVEEPYAARYDGRRWNVSPVHGSEPIAAADAVSEGDIWAVLGNRAPDLSPLPPAGSAVLRWNGTAWHQLALPAALARHGYLTSVMARSDRDVWVAGAVREQPGPLAAIAAHWNGRNWTVTHLRLPHLGHHYVVTSLAPDGRGGAWAAGECVSCGGQPAAVIWHLSHGRWSAPISAYTGRSVFAISLAQVARTRSVWGVGGLTAHKTIEGMIAITGPVPARRSS